MDKNIRRQIEHHFFNYEEDLKTAQADINDILGSGQTAAYGALGGRGSGISNPTERKAILTAEISQAFLWGRVVDNTFNHFMFDPIADLLELRYKKRKNHRETIDEMIMEGKLPTDSESTYWFWYDKAISIAFLWALKYGLMTITRKE